MIFIFFYRFVEIYLQTTDKVFVANTKLNLREFLQGMCLGVLLVFVNALKMVWMFTLYMYM